MSIQGIDSITYGVEDLAACRRFFLDWGLQLEREAPRRLEFATLNGCQVVVADQNDPGLPPAIEPGPTLREIVWGADTPSDIDRFAKSLTNSPGYFTRGGEVGCADPNGIAIRVRVSQKRSLDVKGVPANTWDIARRVDTPTTLYERAQPVEVGHLVFFTESLAEMEKFYCGRLGFHVSDRYPGRGVFLRGAETGGHHDLFLMQPTPPKRGMEHVAFTVRDIHEVFGGGLHISRCGWQTVIGPGRHPVSSAFFWYFRNPAGGMAEYYADEDVLTGAWRPREMAPTAHEFAEWAIIGGLDGHTHRQATGPD
jgi:catechol 2,3-dioxygenase-like lactoylglutathione lyase family enzyme